MLGHPEAVIAQRLAVLRERNGVTDRLAVRAAHNGDRLIENGKAQGTSSLPEAIRLVSGLRIADYIAARLDGNSESHTRPTTA